MTRQENFSRIAHLTDLNVDLARNTAFYQKVKSNKTSADKLMKKSLYQTMPLIKANFARHNDLDEFWPFLKWANQLISDRDSLNATVQRFTRYYDTVSLRRYLLNTNIAIELYLNNYYGLEEKEKSKKKIDDDHKPNLLDQFKQAGE